MRMQHFKDHFTPNNHNSPVSRISSVTNINIYVPFYKHVLAFEAANNSLPKRFISSHCYCSVTKLYILPTSTLGRIQNLVKHCSNQAFENWGANYFRSVKNKLEEYDKFHRDSDQSFYFLPYIPVCPDC